jgi:hypothetical protein
MDEESGANRGVFIIPRKYDEYGHTMIAEKVCSVSSPPKITSPHSEGMGGQQRGGIRWNANVDRG